MVEGILHLHGAVAYALIFIVPALEASIFLGFVFPGEVVVLLGGVLAFEHGVTLPGAIAFAVAGAIVGDSIGYEVGRNFGSRLLAGPLRRIVKPEHRERATAFLHRYRGRAVFFGRFAAALRALVPGMAGIAEIPYTSFLLWNALGGIVWATGFTLIGFAAGKGYRRVEHLVGRASQIVLGLVAAIVIVALIARWVARNPERISAWWQRQMRRRVLRRLRGPLEFVGRRFHPREAFGLRLTFGLVVIGLVGWGFGAVLQDVASRQEIVHFDRPVLDWLIAHTGADMTTFMKVVTGLGGVWFIGAASLVVLLVLALRGSWLRVWLVFLSLAGATALEIAIEALVKRPRPAVMALVHASGFGFPSGHATRAAAFYGALAIVIARGASSWTRKVGVWTGTFLIAALVAFSRLYLRVHYLTDVIGGLALGALWLSVVASGIGVWEAARRSD
ncbi:MAG: bifunctional DedA family/phosphatase PAP2 family protein [Actinomycetota bacterium]